MTTKKQATPEIWVDPDDAPHLTAEFFERAEWRYGDVVIRKGRPVSGKAKEMVSLRLDPDVLAGLRALGPGWQAKAAEALGQLVANSSAAVSTPGEPSGTTGLS